MNRFNNYFKNILISNTKKRIVFIEFRIKDIQSKLVFDNPNVGLLVEWKNLNLELSDLYTKRDKHYRKTTNFTRIFILLIIFLLFVIMCVSLIDINAFNNVYD